jgi:RNA-binding protein
MQLSGKAIRYLRGLGHDLEPVVHIGKEGATKGLITAIQRALTDHELIKIRVLPESPIGPRDAGDFVAINSDSTLVQQLGRTVLLYRRHPKEPKIVLPVKA